MSTSSIHRPYRVAIQQPPGSIVAPTGFPADPRPDNAPQTFVDAMTVRLKVFCDEQKCSMAEELDTDDPRSWSWVLYQGQHQDQHQNQDQGQQQHDQTNTDEQHDVPVSTIRLVPPPHAEHPNGFVDPEEEPYVKLTRVATLAGSRGKGLSRKLIEEAFGYLASQPGVVGGGWKGMVLTHAQVSVERMYQKMGFVTDDRLGRWYEEGIEHVGMWKRLDVKT